jgi:hypothetical protein
LTLGFAAVFSPCFFLGGGEGEPDSESESSLSSSSRLGGGRPFLLTGEGLRFLAGSGDSIDWRLSGFPLPRDASSFPLLGFGAEESLESDSDPDDELSLSSFTGFDLLTSGDLRLTSGDLSCPLRCLSSDLFCTGSLRCGDSCRTFRRRGSGDLESLRGEPADSRRLRYAPSELIRCLGGESCESTRRLLPGDRFLGGDRWRREGDPQRGGGEYPREYPSLLMGLLQLEQ